MTSELYIDLPAEWVPGEGRIIYGAMIIGEAPGKDEWEQKRPFIGASGTYLRETLESLGVDPADCYITNCVKYRPTDEKGKDRRPTEDELEQCKGILIEEIAQVDPHAILALGATAFNWLVGTKLPITTYRGRWTKMQNWLPYAYPLLPTVHSAATMYNPKLKTYFERDVETYLRG